MTTFEAVPTIPLTFWSLIRRTFSVLKDRPLFFFGLAVMVMLPISLLEWWGHEVVGIKIVDSILSTMLTGAVVYSIFEGRKEKDNVPIGRALANTINGPFGGIALMWALFEVLRLICVNWINCQGGGLTWALVELVLVGLQVWLAAVFLPAIPACVVEKIGVWASLKRCMELTRNYRSRVFFTLLGTACLFVLPAFLLFLGFSSFLFGEFFLPVIGMHPITLPWFAYYLMYTIYVTLLLTFSAVIEAIIYCDLRDIADGRLS